jgi:hypothetical protein
MPFERNPLAFLLMFCDLAQQEGRLPEKSYANKYEAKLRDVIVTGNEEHGAVHVELGYSELGKQCVEKEMEWTKFFKQQIEPYGKWKRPDKITFDLEYQHMDGKDFERTKFRGVYKMNF